MMGNKKLQVWLPLIFSLVLILGMFLGYKLNTGNSGNKGFFKQNKRNSLQEVLDIVKLKYVDPVQIDSLQGKAIEGIMSDLDPHSVYLPPVDLKESNEDLAGNFEGIGVEFNVFSDTVNVVFVLPDGPSDKAGLQIGDKIIKVNDSVIANKSLSVDDIKKYIRGPGGSIAKLEIIQGGKSEIFQIKRGNIAVPVVDASYMVDKTTGYIKLNKFTENSYEEFMQSMESLKKQGMQSLVFDLRGNGGGFMNEAVDMADEFLDGDKLVVYTEGYNNKKREFRCKRPGIFETGKLVVLVDELSASASEVLTGSLQDWCRAKIIGRRTFGKGLVQEQYSLSDGSAIRLTVARYYTPLGRSIQRSYEKGKKIYMDELWQRYSNGDLLFADSNKIRNVKPFITVCKDTVYGGDGIMPDVFVPIDTTLYSEKLNYLVTGNNISSIVYNYFLSHRQEVDRYKSTDDYVKQFNSEILWNSFLKSSLDSLKNKKITGKEKEEITLRLKALLARFKWRNAGYFQVLNFDDPVVKKALLELKK